MSTTWQPLQDALAAEHAAIWAYGAIGALLAGDLRPMAVAADATHRARRTEVEGLLIAAGQTPVSAEPAYRLPDSLVDQDAAVALATTLEDGLASSWRFVLGSIDVPQVRAAAVDYLAASAVQALRWRQVSAGASATVPAFPGLP